MEEKKTVVTEEGRQELENELYQLIHVEQPSIIEDLQAARSQGDLSENADYDAAREHQAKVAARITEIEHMLANVEIIDDKVSKAKNKWVRLGSTVVIEALDTNPHEVDTYAIVGTVEADPLNGKLSNEAPLAVALLDHKVNDVVTVFVQHPYKVKILEIK